jgi:Protein of unknown function (DUF3108)
VIARTLALLLSLAVPAQVPTEGADAVAPAVQASLELPGSATATAAVAKVAAQGPASVPRSNESMEYSVSYLGLPMGKARLFVGSVESTVAPVFLQAQTSSLLSFITLRQQLATYLDLETGLPRRSTLDAVEGSYRHNDATQFDREANKATVREKGRHDNTYLVDVPPGTLDFVGLVFKLRTLPLEPGTRHEFDVLAGRRLKKVAAEVLGRETVDTKIGEFPALKVRIPTGFSGKFSEKNPTIVWFSDDDRRIVVRITSDFAVGHATAGLVAYTPGKPSAAKSAAAEAVTTAQP